MHDVNDPESKSCIAMAIAMAMHFFGYEFARGSNVALFTSGTHGFGSNSGSYYPLAMTLVSPMSIALLLSYGRQLDDVGPRRALRNTTLLCISVLASSGMAVAAMRINDADGGGLVGWASAKCLSWTFGQLIVWASFVFQNSYAQLLYAQQWSFIGSICTPKQAGTYYSYIAGLSSISSMIAGASVSKVVGRTGLSGLLGVAAASLSCTCLLADWAYSLSDAHGFGPEWEKKRNIGTTKKIEDTNEDESRTSSTSRSEKSRRAQTSNPLVAQIRYGASLFRRVPTLGALFFEALTFQSLSTILNTCLVTQLRDSVPNDADRAAWTGKFYASVNGLSTVFQFFIMPTLSKYAEPKTLWRLMPILPFVCGVFQSIPASVLPDGLGMSSSSAALYLIALSFLTAKTMDYSLRNILAEMAYMPLSFDARFKGKEIVAVFANRFGKSGMALILSGLHFSSGSKVGLSGLSLAVSVAWLSSVVCLSNLIPSKEEAEQLVAERNKSDDDNRERKKRR
jgi:hypothetical protein